MEHLLFAEIATHTSGARRAPRPRAGMVLGVHGLSATLSAQGSLTRMMPAVLVSIGR